MAENVYVNNDSISVPDFEGYPCSLTAEELTAANDLFQHYVFFQPDKKNRNTWMLWTSCCQRNGERYELFQRTMDSAQVDFATSRHNDGITCPYCGRKAILKDLGKIGAAKQLGEYIPAVFLKAGSTGELYATGFWIWKGYDFHRRGEYLEKGDISFTLRPMFKITSCYKFEPGRATMHERQWFEKIKWETTTESLTRPHGKKKVKEPFTTGGGLFTQYCDYHVIGFDEIEKSAFKYCQYSTFRCHSAERYIGTHSCLMRYLAAASLYPRAMEMLVKIGMGMRDLVWQLIFSKKKNKDLLNWEEADPRKAFGLTAQELREWISMRSDVELLRTYKRLAKLKLPVSFIESQTINREFYNKGSRDFVRYCGRYRIKPMRFIKYLEQFSGPRCHGTGITVEGVFRHWRDYVDAAEAIDYDLTVERVLLPKFLEEAHDAATAEHNRRLEKKAFEENKKVIEGLVRRYSFEHGGYIVRPAYSGEEIVAEGRAQRHCVGGYAERHMTGKLVICFLRSAAEPQKPLVTIELNTNGTMRQVHGYHNDEDENFNPLTPAEETYKHILMPWLKWIAEGSKRDEEGKPILEKPARTRKKKEDHAA